MLLVHRVRKILWCEVFERVGVGLSEKNGGKIVSYVRESEKERSIACERGRGKIGQTMKGKRCIPLSVGGSSLGESGSWYNY